MKALAWTVAAAVAVALSAITHGYVLAKLWMWFAVPMGLPPVGMATALGLSTLVRLTTYHVDWSKKSNESDWAEVLAQLFVTAIIYPGFSLLLGYIYLQFS